MRLRCGPQAATFPVSRQLSTFNPSKDHPGPPGFKGYSSGCNWNKHATTQNLCACERDGSSKMGRSEGLFTQNAFCIPLQSFSFLFLSKHALDRHVWSLHTRLTSIAASRAWYAIFPDVLNSGAGKPWTLGAAAEDAIQAPGDDLSPSAASGLQDLHPQPLRSSPRDAVIVENSIVRHVRATLAEGKVHTHCFPGASVLNVSAQILTILKRASGRSCCMQVWTTPSCGRRRHWKGTSGAWSRRYAAHCLQRRSSCQDLFARIDEDTKGSVDCLL